MGKLSRLIDAVFGSVERMSVPEADSVGERLPANHPSLAGKLLGAAARIKVAEHDAEFDYIADVAVEQSGTEYEE